MVSLMTAGSFLAPVGLLASAVLAPDRLWGETAIAQPEVAIEADTIEFDQGSALVLAEGNFVVSQGGAELHGDREFKTQRLEGNHRNEIFLLEGNVSSPLDTDLEVRSNAMVYRGVTEEATFTGDVEVVSAGWTITATRAELNEGELILFDGWKEANSTARPGEEDIEPLPSLFDDDEPEDRRESFDSLTLDIATRVARLNVAED